MSGKLRVESGVWRVEWRMENEGEEWRVKGGRVEDGE